MFQNCSTHNTRLAPSLIGIVPQFEPAEKVVKKQQVIHCQSGRNGKRVAYDRGYGAWLSCVQGSLVCCCWRRAVLCVSYDVTFLRMHLLGVSVPPGSYATFLQHELLGIKAHSSLQPLHSLQHVSESEVLVQEKASHNSNKNALLLLYTY